MKKFFIMSLCFLCVCIVLVSCAQTSSTTDTTQENNTVHSPSDGDPLTLDFTDLAEYRAYMEQAKLPANFIHYDDIAYIGEFYLFSCIHPESDGEENWLKNGEYYYILSNGNYILHIDPAKSSELSQNNLISETIIPNDLRNLNSSVSGTVVFDSAQYQYLDGRLLSIKWTCDDVAFTLAISDNTLEAPSAFIQNLFNKDTASSQIKSFQETMAEKNLSK